MRKKPRWQRRELDESEAKAFGLTLEQYRALRELSATYKVPFMPSAFKSAPDLPWKWVAGWVGGAKYKKVYVDCGSDGEIRPLEF